MGTPHCRRPRMPIRRFQPKPHWPSFPDKTGGRKPPMPPGVGGWRLVRCTLSKNANPLPLNELHIPPHTAPGRRPGRWGMSPACLVGGAADAACLQLLLRCGEDAPSAQGGINAYRLLPTATGAAIKAVFGATLRGPARYLKQPGTSTKSPCTTSSKSHCRAKGTLEETYAALWASGL